MTELNKQQFEHQSVSDWLASPEGHDWQDYHFGEDFGGVARETTTSPGLFSIKTDDPEIGNVFVRWSQDTPVKELAAEHAHLERQGKEKGWDKFRQKQMERDWDYS